MEDVDLPVDPEGADVENALESCARDAGLHWTKTTLLKYPGSVHWHLTKAGQRGTLEATWWPAKGRLWLSAHKNRQAAWQRATVAQLADSFSNVQRKH